MALMSYGRAMALHAERDPDGIAVFFDDEEIRRDALERRSNRLARAFAARGVGEGDLVTIALPNCIAFYEAALATWKLGATPQPVSSRLPLREREAIVALARPKLIVGAEVGGLPAWPAGREPGPEFSGAPLPDRVAREARAMTSGGSTGRPKVIIDTSPAECDPDAPENRMRAGAVALIPGPLYHAGPFIASWNQLLCGGSVVLLERFDAERCLALIERHRVDYALFVPTMMQRIWRLPEAVRAGYDLSSLTSVMCSGAPSPQWLKRAWIDWLGPERILEAYGGTERIAGTQITGSEWLDHPGSVGLPTGGRKLKVLGEDGRELPPGEVGEVFMMPARGQGTTYRYIGAEATATRDGWESLGDLGWMDADGYLYLVDRKSDMIVTGGANVYPAEVEAAIDAHPAVRSCAVVGLVDDDLGRRVHAIVDAPQGVDETRLRAHLAEHLAGYKIPRTFEFVDDPLRDDAGKLRRSALRDARQGG